MHIGQFMSRRASTMHVDLDRSRRASTMHNGQVRSRRAIHSGQVSLPLIHTGYANYNPIAHFYYLVNYKTILVKYNILYLFIFILLVNNSPNPWHYLTLTSRPGFNFYPRKFV